MKINRCSRCKLDINTTKEDGGCKCCKERAPSGGRETPKGPNLDKTEGSGVGVFKSNAKYSNFDDGEDE